MPPTTAARGEFGRRVRAQRQKLGLSQERIALDSELSWSWIGRVERGQVNPTFDNILRLADLLKIDAGKLMTGLHYEE